MASGPRAPLPIATRSAPARRGTVLQRHRETHRPGEVDRLQDRPRARLAVRPGADPRGHPRAGRRWQSPPRPPRCSSTTRTAFAPQLWEPCTLIKIGGKDATEHAIKQPLFDDQLRIVQATGLAAERHARFVELDADTGIDDVEAMLTNFAEAFGQAWRDGQSTDGA